jgi:3-polyprenyl-4-hydroxybenzoate decarboxylase
MAYYKDVREYLQALENNDKLVRIKQPINKDTELHPLVRLQYRPCRSGSESFSLREGSGS